MILLSVVFTLLLVLTFAVVMVLTRPSPADRAIEARVAGIQASTNGAILAEGASEMFKRTRLSEVGWLDTLLQHWNVIQKIRLLALQAESTWSVPVTLGISIG